PGDLTLQTSPGSVGRFGEGSHDDVGSGLKSGKCFAARRAKSTTHEVAGHRIAKLIAHDKAAPGSTICIRCGDVEGRCGSSYSTALTYHLSPVIGRDQYVDKLQHRTLLHVH